MEQIKKKADDARQQRGRALPSSPQLLAIEGRPSVDPAPMSGAGGGIRIVEIPNSNDSDLSKSGDQSNMEDVD